jgi:hypothetical protein
VAAPNLGPQCIAKLLGFAGYGPAAPRFVFIGPEEGSEGSPINLQTRCNAFPSTRHDREIACRDLAAGFNAQGLRSEAQRYLDALTPGTEPTWTLAARLVAALRDPPTAWEDEYRRLGTLDGDTLLTELFPLPKPGMRNWPPPYVRMFGYRNQDAYYNALWPRGVTPGSGVSRRADLLASTLANIPLSQTSYVFGYGRGARKTSSSGGKQFEFWERFDRLFAMHGKWTTVMAEVAEVARHSSGAVVARLAHPSRNQITTGDLPALLAAIHKLP